MPKAGKVHIIGAGLAGLACAIRLSRQGTDVHLYEAADHAGGRCRSFHDPHLDRRIDNGNHLLLSGNDAALGYLEQINARDTLVISDEALFPFMEMPSGLRWQVHANKGAFPWWIFCKNRRVPGSSPFDYLRGLKLKSATLQQRVADCFDTKDPLFKRFWEPLAVGVLNASPQEGAAILLWPVIALTFGKGGNACRPVHPREGFSQTFIDPAVSWLEGQSASLKLNCRLRAIERDDTTITALNFSGHRVEVGADDSVVLALPPANLSSVLPEIPVPLESRTIVNVHFRLPEPTVIPGHPQSHFIGLVGSIAQWLFVRGDVASVTVSAANDLSRSSSDEIAGKIWPEVVAALALPENSALPFFKVIKEKRATFAQTPEALSKRAKTKGPYNNLYLAGDWTDTGLPATIEGAICSGNAAAGAILSMQ